MTPAKAMFFGYARASFLDQNLAKQQDALEEIERGKIFIEQMYYAVRDKPELTAALTFARTGDTVDRDHRYLAVSNIRFTSLIEFLDTTAAQRIFVFLVFSALAKFLRAMIRERTRTGLTASADAP